MLRYILPWIVCFTGSIFFSICVIVSTNFSLDTPVFLFLNLVSSSVVVIGLRIKYLRTASSVMPFSSRLLIDIDMDDELDDIGIECSFFTRFAGVAVGLLLLSDMPRSVGIELILRLVESWPPPTTGDTDREWLFWLLDNGIECPELGPALDDEDFFFFEEFGIASSSESLVFELTSLEESFRSSLAAFFLSFFFLFLSRASLASFCSCFSRLFLASWSSLSDSPDFFSSSESSSEVSSFRSASSSATDCCSLLAFDSGSGSLSWWNIIDLVLRCLKVSANYLSLESEI